METIFNDITAGLAAYAPRVLGAVAILLVGMLVARLLATGVRKLLQKLGTDQQVAGWVNRPEDQPAPGVSHGAGRVVQVLVMVFVLVATFQTLGLTLITEPLNSLLNEVFTYAPQLLGGLVLAAVAFAVAWLLRVVLRRTLADGRLDRQVDAGRTPLSHTIPESVFYLVLLLFTPAVLDAMGMDGLLAPVTGLVDSLLAALPGLFGAALILIAATLIGRIVANLAENLLTGVGFDTLPRRLGLVSNDDAMRRPPSNVAAQVIMLGIMLFAAMSAAQVAGLTAVATMLDRFLVFAGQVILGVAILALGLALANLAAGAVRGTGRANAATLARVARGAILALTAAMALREMGLAGEIVNLAFGLTLGAVAVAAALAFGLGGRDAAAHQLRRWRGDDDGVKEMENRA